MAAVGWAAALPAAAWIAARPTAPPLYAFAFTIYAVGSVICHQLPQRSFHLWSAQMPVCARCTGIYVGGAVVAIGVLVHAARLKRRSTGTARLKPRPAYNFSRARSILLVAAIPTIATLVFEWTTGEMPANGIRALAGCAIGAAVVWAIASDVH